MFKRSQQYSVGKAFGVDAKVLARFISRVKVSDDGCINWTGELSGGYGHLSVDGRNIPAHRLAYMIAHKRTIPRGFVVRHKCDNRACVNPDHLFLGSLGDNAFDERQKQRGTRSILALKLSTALRIRSEINEGRKIIDLAKQHDLTSTQIALVCELDYHELKAVLA